MNFSFLPKRITTLRQQEDICRRIAVGEIATDTLTPARMAHATRAARMARRLEDLSFRKVAR